MAADVRMRKQLSRPRGWSLYFKHSMVKPCVAVLYMDVYLSKNNVKCGDKADCMNDALMREAAHCRMHRYHVSYVLVRY
jgi:hypothetical protein